MPAVHHLRLRPDGLNECRAIVLTGAVPALSVEAAAAADEADRIHQRQCRRAGVNPLGANGAFVQALL